jgi:hypothetical protein
MELYLMELADANKKNNNTNVSVCIDFRGETLLFDTCNVNKYTELEQRQIIERFFYKYIDLIFENNNYSLFTMVLDHLYAGDYILLSMNIKSYLFESLELCSPKPFLSWIFSILDNENEMSKINIQAFTTYVDMKRKRGLTNGEIRYTIICESTIKILELVLSKIYRDQLTSKHVWLATFRLKQQLSMTSTQKDIFNEWLGIV